MGKGCIIGQQRSFNMQLTYYEACRRIRKFSNDARDDTKDGKNVGLKLKHWSKVPAKTSKARDGEDEEMATSGECATQTLLVRVCTDAFGRC